MSWGGTPNALEHIDHFVLLMLENRSFDNMLGWLDSPGTPFAPPAGTVPLDGLFGRRLANPVPAGLAPGHARTVVPGRTWNSRTPDPDPGEGFAHTHLQLYGVPLAAGAVPPGPAPMDGFVRDYIEVLAAAHRPLAPDLYGQVMDGFAPAAVPVMSGLARAYAVCDGWHASVPSETLPNRAFALAGTSLGQADNTPYTHWLALDVPTICNRIQDAGIPGLTWRVYYDLLDVLPLSWLQFPRLRPFLFSHFSGMDAFWKDAAAGTLPSFAFIEPRLLVDPNDQHPPYSVAPGEALIHAVVQALAGGPAWEHTLLAITYDEHGGCFDHVPPPAAVPPEGTTAGQYGFGFNRLGVRIPAVLVSPWIPPATVFRGQGENGPVALDHTSWLATVERRFGLAPLTRRDAAATDLAAALSLAAPRRDRPVLPRPAPASPSRARSVLADHVRRLAEGLAQIPAQDREMRARIGEYLRRSTDG